MNKPKVKISFDSVLPSKETTEPIQPEALPLEVEAEDTNANASPTPRQTRSRKVGKSKATTGDDVYKTIAIRLNKSEYQEIRKYQLEAELSGKSAASLASMGKTMIMKQVRRATNV